MAEKLITHKRYTPTKKRSQSCYQRKVNKITNWYNRLLKYREEEIKINPNNKLPYKKRELKSLDYYIDKLKKPQGENK